jgi:very-short-patch-repair endonuclease
MWIRLGRGVYAVAGSVASWERQAIARVLEAGDGAALSHEAAAYAHRLVDQPPARIDVTVPHGRVRSNAHRARNFTRADVRMREGIAVTCVARTIVDVAGVFVRRRLEDVVDRALLRGLITVPSQRAYIAGRGLGRRRSVATLQRVLDDREGGVPATELERAFERLLRRSKIPLPDRQIRVGKRRVDFIYQRERLWIEVNGRKDHGKKAVFEDDHVRHNEIALELVDFLHLRFTWDQVTKHKRYVAETVSSALGARR